MLLIISLLSTSVWLNAQQKQIFYEIKIYHFSSIEQEALLDRYYEKAFIPAAHQAGIKQVGVFKPVGNDTAADKCLYVVLPFTSPEQMIDLPFQLEKNSAYTTNGHDYINAPYTAPPYTRIESVLLKAFKTAPVMQLPRLQSAKAEHIYELRSYEGHTEKISRNKIHMFNEGGEVPLFRRLNFNAIFYGEVIAGSRMPNLMYMTSFENMQDRDAHWETFRADSEWKSLSSRQEYQKNVSRSEIILMKAAPYSDY